MFVESDLRMIEGKIEKIILNERSYKITLIVNQTNYTLYLKNNVYFKFGDRVEIIFHGKHDQIDAVLNLENGYLYLDPLIYEVNPNSLKEKLRKIVYYTTALIVILIAELALYQLVMDGTIYYFDIAKYALFIMIFSMLLAFYISFKNLSKTEHRFSKKVFELLNLPNMEQEQLKYLRMTNSYFEVIPNLYFMEHVINIAKKHSSNQTKEIVDRMCSNRNAESLTEFQELKFKLQLQKGMIQEIKKIQIPKDDIHTDPFTEVTATLNGLSIYGYFDEFHLKNKQEVKVILTQFSDDKGYYIWYMYDGEKYLYLDEDQPTTISEKFGWTEAIITMIFIGVFILLFWFVFALFDDFIFFTYVAIALMQITVFYQVAKVYFTRKFDHESRTKIYVFQQIKALASLPKHVYWHDLGLYGLYRENQVEPSKSRTGYDLSKPLE